MLAVASAFAVIALAAVRPGSAAAESTPTSCAGVPGKAYVAAPEGWANQCQMVNDTDVTGDGLDRETFVIDPGVGSFLSRDDLLAHAADYARLGFSQAFLWWAPMTQVHPDPNTKWSACRVPDLRPTKVFCASVNLAPVKTIGQDLTRDDTLDAIAYGPDWIALGCGNFQLPVTGVSPTPVIDGVKFDDANRDGVQDGGEGGVGGIVFTLSRTSSFVGQPAAGNLATATSDANGNFSFALDRGDEGPGVYVVSEQFSSDWPNTTPLTQTIVVPEGAGDGSGLPTLRFGDREEIPPVAVATPVEADQSSAQGAAVTLDGSGSYSPTGDALTYSWSGPFGTATGATPTVTMPPGVSRVTLTVSDGLKTDSTTTTVTVFPPITAQPVALAAVEGSEATATVATFTDPDPNGLADDYVATVDWGDGTASSAAAVGKRADGTFTVTASHTFADEGSYSPKVTITDDDVPFNTARVTASATVADAPITAAGVDFLSVNPVDQTLATFTDGNPGSTTADFTASIDWGDGTPPTAGTVTSTGNAAFAVAGSHTYAALGPKTVTIQIVDDGGSSATAVDHVLLYEPSNFVIGDRNAAVGTSVTFWGAQWWKLNSLSGGPAPAAFKGYADSPGGASGGWTTAPGNSSGPPAAVASYIGVIVSSTIAQSGSTISGDAPHVVVVQTDAGYAADPGHAGTGTVVAVQR